MYLSISVSEWYELNTGCVRNESVRLSPAGMLSLNNSTPEDSNISNIVFTSFISTVSSKVIPTESLYFQKL